jgi:hypothetical protein
MRTSIPAPATTGVCATDGIVETATLTLWVSHRWQVSEFCKKCGSKINAPVTTSNHRFDGPDHD